MTYEHGGKRYVAVLSGVGGWAGIGLAAGLVQQNAAAWHGAVDQGKLPTKEKPSIPRASALSAAMRAWRPIPRLAGR